MKISAVVLTKNEENNIGECLKTLKFCDEIIVIDDNSSDNTQEIVKSFGVKLFLRELDNNFADQRNFGLDKANSDWILFLDADERISINLSNEIKKKINKNDVFGYYIKRTDNLWGKEIKYGETGKIKLLRLARKNAGRWERDVHEEWKIKGEIEQLINPIIHYPHPVLKEFLKDINYFSDLHAKSNLREGKKSNIFKIVVYPKLKFIKDYFFYLGFLDSTQGLLIALIMSLHSFLSWSKLWILQKKISQSI